MPLNLSVGENEFTPYLKYNAKAGRFYLRPEGATEDVEITTPTLAFDMANIKTGWIYYTEGTGPEKVWDASNDHPAPKPPGPKKFKRGFEVMTCSNALIPGTKQKIGAREFSSTAGNVIAAIVQMFAAFEAGAPANRGKVPIFCCEGVKPVVGTYGTNYEPKFTLKGWVERSRIPEFDEHVAAPTVVSQPASENPAEGFSDNIPF
jgi:hypothetical protein